MPDRIKAWKQIGFRAFILCLVLSPLVLHSRTITLSRTLQWDDQSLNTSSSDQQHLPMRLKGQIINGERGDLPEFREVIQLKAGEFLESVTFTNMEKERITMKQSLPAEMGKYLPEHFTLSFQNGTFKHQGRGLIIITPIQGLAQSRSLERLTSFTIEISIARRVVGNAHVSKQKYADQSVLASGQWFKFGVTQNAVYKVNYQFLEALGIDASSIVPSEIRIYGNGGGMLPTRNSDFRHDDLVENAIEIYGGNDGRFDPGDYIVFYGQGPDRWIYDAGPENFRHQTNLYSDTSYYFITFGNGSGTRISTQSDQPGNDYVSTTFNDFLLHELDQISIMHSGKQWFGEVFDIQTEYELKFHFPHLLTSEPLYARARMAASAITPSYWKINGPGNTLTAQCEKIKRKYGNSVASEGMTEGQFNSGTDLVKLRVSYEKPAGQSNAKGWLDYVELNGRRKSIMVGNQMTFRDVQSIGAGITEFHVTGCNDKTVIWDITDPLNPRRQNFTLSTNEAIFGTLTDQLKEFIAFDAFDSSLYALGEIQNQNLHAIDAADMVIVYHARFKDAAEQLKEFHEEEGLSVVSTNVDHIFNEFASGSRDIVAIRDYLRMIYNKSGKSGPNYMLIMGDGSFDYKGIRYQGNNFIPTFQSYESFSPVYSYTSDDYYGMLDSNEGTWNDTEFIDVAIGRLPVQTKEEAQLVVNKIMRYNTPSTMNDWRNAVMFIADDVDASNFISHSEGFTKRVDAADRNFNIEKVYCDAYQQFSTPGGQRYPGVRDAINRVVQRGALLINYTGHGGGAGWAHERILGIGDINQWNNADNLPIFVTATCEFSRFDDPGKLAGGERILLNPDGGGIALLTTVRLVTSGDNESLANALYEQVFAKNNGQYRRLGEVFREVKNQVTNTSARNFTLMGDPALRMAIPQHQAHATTINGQLLAVTDTVMDTIRALQKVTIEGHLTDDQGNLLNNFNGILYPTLFDKSSEINTELNDLEGTATFNIQTNKLFKGRASVRNGKYTFSFIVPKDIAYQYGRGKISLYARDSDSDAAGHNLNFAVGGTYDGASEDLEGPMVELFLNDETFINGGITDGNPVLIANIQDLHGVNMTGAGIGHDITATLDGKSADAIILNDYYQSELDSYQSGKVKYQFQELAEGPHTLDFKVWDVYNNATEVRLNFVVQKDKDIVIEKVLNYPNPFTTYTEFWFEHNQPNVLLDVKIQIFTISGKIVRSIDRTILTEGFAQNRQDPIVWNGRDDFGDLLGRGVYVYKLQVRSRANGSVTEQLEKLLIL